MRHLLALLCFLAATENANAAKTFAERSPEVLRRAIKLGRARQKRLDNDAATIAREVQYHRAMVELNDREGHESANLSAVYRVNDFLGKLAAEIRGDAPKRIDFSQKRVWVNGGIMRSGDYVMRDVAPSVASVHRTLDLVKPNAAADAHHKKLDRLIDRALDRTLEAR
jgi:hypothetical protein